MERHDAAVSTLVSRIEGATGVAADREGNVFFADLGSNAIKEWNATTQTVSTLVSPGLNLPNGVAVDASGNIYMADCPIARHHGATACVCAGWIG